MKPVFLSLLLTASSVSAQWTTIVAEGEPVPRHEAGFTAIGNKAYLVGGRRVNPVSIYDPATKTWTKGALSPIEIHHFQPIVYQDEIWVVGAMTGRFPNETPVERILIYDPAEDAWRWGPKIPKGRARGGAGVSLYQGKIYLSCGITRGHMGGFIPWHDRFDPQTGEWEILPDAPHARDHFQSAIIDNKLYLAGGRQTSKETNAVLSQTVGAVDVYDFAAQSWNTLAKDLPTPRAGNTTFSYCGRLIVIGGETDLQPTAYSEVDAYDVRSESWTSLPPLNRGRHGTGIAIIDNQLYTASGSGNKGGQPELLDIETMSCDGLGCPSPPPPETEAAQRHHQ